MLPGNTGFWSVHLYSRLWRSNNSPHQQLTLLLNVLVLLSFICCLRYTNLATLGGPTVSACACPTEKLALYLDKVTALFVGGLGSYVKDTTQKDGGQRLVFTMGIKSLYTVIPNDEGLVSPKYFLDKWEVKDPPTDTLVCMAELVLTLNTFEFKGEYYKQVGGVEMGSRLGPNYVCLFVGYVEKRMLAEYTGRKPDLYKRYMDDVASAASGSEQDLQQFHDFASKYHPKLVYTWSISSVKLPYIDIYLLQRH